MIIKNSTKIMAKKRKALRGSRDDSQSSLLEHISKETLNAILGVLSIVLTLFLFMAAFGKGGPVGDTTYIGLSFLFGIGYYLVPIAFLMLGISFFQAREKNFALPQII